MRRFAPALTGPASVADDGPIATLNMTPLIDVLLVLLVMFILSVPAMTHEVPIELPQAAPVKTLPVVTHRLVLARDGTVTVDGVGMADAALRPRLKRIVADRQAVLVMKTDSEARYERFDQVLAVVKRAGVTRLGFEGNAGLAE